MKKSVCDDELGWLLVTIYDYSYSHIFIKHYKTLDWAQRKADEFNQMLAMSPGISGRCFLIQLSEAERWHKSTGIDELERLMKL